MLLLMRLFESKQWLPPHGNPKVIQFCVTIEPKLSIAWPLLKSFFNGVPLEYITEDGSNRSYTYVGQLGKYLQCMLLFGSNREWYIEGNVEFVVWVELIPLKSYSPRKFEEQMICQSLNCAIQASPGGMMLLKQLIEFLKLYGSYLDNTEWEQSLWPVWNLCHMTYTMNKYCLPTKQITSSRETLSRDHYMVLQDATNTLDFDCIPNLGVGQEVKLQSISSTHLTLWTVTTSYNLGLQKQATESHVVYMITQYVKGTYQLHVWAGLGVTYCLLTFAWKLQALLNPGGTLFISAGSNSSAWVQAKCSILFKTIALAVQQVHEEVQSWTYAMAQYMEEDAVKCELGDGRFTFSVKELLQIPWDPGGAFASAWGQADF